MQNVVPYGAFVSLANGLTGLLHISQISRSRIMKTEDVLQKGGRIKASGPPADGLPRHTVLRNWLVGCDNLLYHIV